MRISDLVDRVEPFEFVYDKWTLKGEWYKYRTTTPNYAKKAAADIPEIPKDITEEEEKKAREARNKALIKVAHQAFADTIKSWDAVDGEGNPVPISPEVFDELPEPFTEKFFTFLNGLRDGTENPTSNGSPST